MAHKTVAGRSKLAEFGLARIDSKGGFLSVDTLMGVIKSQPQGVRNGLRRRMIEELKKDSDSGVIAAAAIGEACEGIGTYGNKAPTPATQAAAQPRPAPGL